MAVSRLGLLRSSSEESFEHIDAEFDSSYYSELRGEAVADFTPVESSQILMRKGDKLVIREQTLDQKSFIVTNLRTDSQGKVPSHLIKFAAEEASMEDTGELVHILHSDLHRPGYIPQDNSIDADSGSSDLDQGGVRRQRRTKRSEADGGSSLDFNGTRHERGGARRWCDQVVPGAEEDETESDLDQANKTRTYPGKKSGKMGIMRRKGVSKSKGSPYRSSGSSHEDDACYLISASQKSGEHHKDELSQTTPHVDPDLTNPASGIVRSSAKIRSDRNNHWRRSQTASNLEGFQPYPPVEDERCQSVGAIPSLPSDLQPEYKLIERHNILSVSGADRDGRPVIVFSSCRLPPTYQISHDRLKEYFLLTLDQYVEQDYTLLYFHHGLSSSNKPSISWLRQIYSELDRKYKKNLKKVYIVHPTNFIRMMMILLKPIISYKFGRKLTYINRLEELRPVLFLEQVDIPDQVKEYDAQLMSQIRNVAKTDSRSLFHVPASPTALTRSTASSTAASSTQQFGVSLATLEEREKGELPLVIRVCVKYLEKEGLEVMGIFRRAPNNVKVRAIKKRFDQGEEVDMAENADPHMAAVLIKMFLRELPEPLLSFDSYNTVMGIRGQNEEARLRICRKVVQGLPKANYHLLRYLMAFIDKVRAHEDANKMNALNLAIVFGPNLLWSTDQAASLVGLGEINSFVHVMIQNKDAIFT